jgi:uncharacterized protein YggE
MDITVVGTARASLAPERGTLHLTLGHEGGDKAQVLEATTGLVQSFSAYVDELKSAQPSPTTWSAILPVRTRSWRPWSDKGQVLPLRHAASAEVRLKYRDFSALAATVDAWGALAGVTVNHVEWALTEATRATQEAEVLRRAVADAQSRAQAMATAAGQGEVRWVELADPGLLQGGARPAAGVESYTAASMRAGKADAGGGTDVAPEDIAWQVQVHARFSAG